MLLSCVKQKKLKLNYKTTYCHSIDDIQSDKSDIKHLDLFAFEDQAVAFFINKADSTINLHFIQTHKTEKYKYGNLEKISILGESYSRFLVINRDSICAISKRPLDKVFLFNIQGQLIDTFPLHTQKRNYTCLSSCYSKMKYHEGRLVVPVNKEVADSDREYFSMAGITVDMHTKSIKTFGRHSKSEILSFMCYSNPYDYLVIRNNKVIFSSEEDHILYEYDIVDDSYQAHQAKSKYISDIEPMSDSSSRNRAEISRYTYESPRYEEIIYDSYRDYVYRIVKHQALDKPSTGLYKEKKARVQYSMIIMNADYQILDEVLIDKKYDANLLIPLPDGILFPNSETSTAKQNGTLCLDFFSLE